MLLKNGIIGFIFTACETSDEDESSDTIPNTTYYQERTNHYQRMFDVNRVHRNSEASTSSEDSDATSKPLPKPLFPSNDALHLDRYKSKILTPIRPRVPKRTNASDFKKFSGDIFGNILPEKRHSDPQIRYAFYNKGFEAASTNRKFSLTQYDVRKNAMPNIKECQSIEDDDSDDESMDFNSADGINHFNINNKCYGGSSGRDITLLPKLKIRICDEMGKRVKSSFDESSHSDENIDTFDAIAEQKCNHIPTLAYDPFQCDAIRVNENFHQCTKCGHKLLLKKQFSNSFF